MQHEETTSQEVQATEVTETQNTPTHDSQPNQSVGDEVPTQPTTPTTPEISEADIAEILAKNIPENPTFKDEKPLDVNNPNDANAIIDELATAADTLFAEREKISLEKNEAVSKLEELTSELENAKNVATQVDELFNSIAKDIPVLSEYAEAKVKGEDYQIPLQYIPENFKRVEDHPIVGPLVHSLLKGEEINPAEFVKALSSSRRSQLPTDVQQSVPTQEKKEIHASEPHPLLPGTSITFN